MKKQITASLTAKAEEHRAEMQSSNPGQGRKVVYAHKPCDHSYGRVNKNPISFQGPGVFH